MANVKIEIDRDYLQSWNGIKRAAEITRMANDGDATDADKLAVLIEHYEHAVVDFDKLLDSLDGDKVPAGEVIAMVGEALAEAMGKNS